MSDRWASLLSLLLFLRLIPACATIVTGDLGASIPITPRSGSAAALGELTAAMGPGCDEGGVGGGAHARVRVGPDLFEFSVSPVAFVVGGSQRAKPVSVYLMAGPTAAGIAVVDGRPAFLTLGPMMKLGVAFRPSPSVGAFVLGFGADYSYRARADVPNAGYLSLTLGYGEVHYATLRLSPPFPPDPFLLPRKGLPPRQPTDSHDCPGP